MIGKRKQQSLLFDVGNVYDLELPPSSFYSQLATAAPGLFKDEDFAAFYSVERGRPSVPPSDLALMLVLKEHDQVSDEEAVARTTFDLRWAAVLRRHAGKPLCAKSTFQLFRSHLVIHDQIQIIFRKSIEEAKQSGLLQGALKAAIDTKPILGRGAVKDTYNLLGEAISLLARQLAKEQRQSENDYLQEAGLAFYTGSSLKGSADLDWSDEGARQTLLTQIVRDARALLQRAKGGSKEVRESAELLSSILLQDVEEHTESPEAPPTAHVKEGTAPGRIPSVTDPEQRHGHKSKNKLFTGNKASVVSDVDSQIILHAEVIAGDAPDNHNALQQIEAAEANTAMTIEESLGDCAYGDGRTRKEFEEAGRTLFAKVPKEHQRGDLFPKSRFTIDLENNTVTCPVGNVADKSQSGANAAKIFAFGRACNACPLRAQCTTNAQGRTVQVHPQERLLQEARAYQQTEEGRKRLRERVVIEHTLARLSHLGIGQARYFGRAKTQCQLLIACTVANLRRVWNWVADQQASDRVRAAA